MTPYIQQTLSLAPEELEKLSKSDKGFTFLHNIALFSRDPKVIRDQIMAVLLAGRDTTAATLSWTLYELANYPAVWTKLRETVLEKVGATRNPTYDDIKGMTYLTHAINETLRLYPAVPYNIRSCRTFTLPTQNASSMLMCLLQWRIPHSLARPASLISHASRETTSSTAPTPCSAAATSTPRCLRPLPTQTFTALTAGTTGRRVPGSMCRSTGARVSALARILPLPRLATSVRTTRRKKAACPILLTL